VKTLFLRIFISFWLAMVLILAGAIAVTATVAWHRIAMLNSVSPGEMMEGADGALANGGEHQLETWLAEIVASHPDLDIYVIDAAGHDVLQRQLPEHLVQWLALDGRSGTATSGSSKGYWPYGYDWAPSGVTASNQPGFNRSHLLANPKIVAPDGTVYTLLVAWFGATPIDVLGADGITIPLVLIAFAISAVVCWWIARYISRPVIKLQAIARTLALGNLEARVDEPFCRRRDELGILAQDFNEMAARLRSQIASKEILLRDISHELRSPLTRLRVALSLAQRGDGNIGTQLERIERDIERLDTLIGQTLQLSRLSSGGPTLAREDIDLGELVNEVVDDAQFEASAVGKRLDLSFLPGLRAHGNFELLRRAVENIVRNAIRFAPAGSTIEISTQSTLGESIVAVRDHGPGVPEFDLERIFEAFYRVAPARDSDSGGVGLGLAIAARIMALHGGGTKAHNASDGGLIVELRFPSSHIVPEDQMTNALV
jgi:two-component system sensor histidine kinase CpxA